MLSNFLLLLGFGFMVWLMVRTIKSHPELFSKNALNKSFYTMGILALVLIVVVGLCIIFLRQSH